MTQASDYSAIKSLSLGLHFVYIAYIPFVLIKLYFFYSILSSLYFVGTKYKKTSKFQGIFPNRANNLAQNKATGYIYFCAICNRILHPKSCRHFADTRRNVVLGLGQTSEVSMRRIKRSELSSWKIRHLPQFNLISSSEWVWIVQHVLSVCFRWIERLKIVSGTNVDLHTRRNKLKN